MSDAMRSPYLLPVLGAIAVTYLPHALYLPVWITLACLCCWGYLLLGRKRGWRAPGKRTRNILTLAVAGLLLAGHGGGFGLEAGVSVLAVLLALKPMELSTRRDALTTLLLTSFLIVFNLFFAQDLVAALLALAGVLALTAAMIQAIHPRERPGHALRLGARLLLQGAPLALVLFLVFPRLPGGLLGYRAPVALSGFSDTLAPGDLGSLALNREVAFRASFENAAPPPDKRYWRGLVLWDFDGERWSAPRDVPRLQHSLAGSAPASYKISLEPHGKRWLFSLDMPLAPVAWSVLRLDHTLFSRIDVTRQRNYALSSFLEYDTGPLTPWEHLRGLALPEGGNPRARELAASWLREEASPEAIVRRCMGYFQGNGFVYTLAPELLGPDAVDDFLFRTKAGFCGHYAMAMAFLLRAAGVPARIVAGYLGGEENPLGEYLILRQADVHAWVEVWLEGQGWVRRDPTLMAAPLRLEEGLLAALAADPSRGQFRRGDGPEWLRSLRLGWDAVNYWWGRAVLDYNWRSQLDILRSLGRRLGLGGWGRRVVAVILGVGAVALGILILLLLGRLPSRRGRAPAEDEAARDWRKLCGRLAKAGLPRPSWQGPLQYARVVAAARPEMAETMREAAQAYARLRYAPLPLDEWERELEEFKRLSQEVGKGLGARGGR